MIVTIEGVLKAKKESSVIVAIGGVGLELFVPLRTLHKLGSEGDLVFFFTYMHVREDAIVLFGFSTEEDKLMFLSLLGVSGVGPKVAMGVISASTAPELAGLICNGKDSALTAFPGIGKKTAQRIILELKDRINMADYGSGYRAYVSAMDSDLSEEVTAALCSLGFTRAAAIKAINRLSSEDISNLSSVEDFVRELLKRSL
ncbi:Holliday junction branch migration protein RuvA [bacterium]|nr:Holliday junction branch migration protein RuvA [bacterium]